MLRRAIISGCKFFDILNACERWGEDALLRSRSRVDIKRDKTWFVLLGRFPTEKCRDPSQSSSPAAGMEDFTLALLPRSKERGPIEAWLRHSRGCE
jgi:hypothetical protein